MNDLAPRGNTGESNYHGCVVVDFYTPLQTDGETPVFRDTWLYMMGLDTAPPSLPRVSARVEGVHVRLEWNSAADEAFTVERRPTFGAPAAWSALATNLPATGGSRTTFIHSNALLSASGFYRVLRTR